MLQEVEESEPATRRLLLSLLSDSSKDAFACISTPNLHVAARQHALLHEGGADHVDAQRMASERAGSELQPLYDFDTDGDAWVAETQDVRLLTPLMFVPVLGMHAYYACIAHTTTYYMISQICISCAF